MEPTYVFNHLPKCYGTSIWLHLRRFMNAHTDYLWYFRDRSEFDAHPYDISTLGAEDLVLGHFNLPGMHLAERYPEIVANPRFQIFTFVREPLEMQVSLYYYAVRMKDALDTPDSPAHYDTLDAYLRASWNLIASALPCDESNYLDVLGRYFFVGVAGQVETSMRVLIDRMARTFDEAEARGGVLRMRRKLRAARNLGLPHENRTTRDGQAGEISAETLAIFRERNALDYRIYDYAVRQLATAAPAA